MEIGNCDAALEPGAIKGHEIGIAENGRANSSASLAAQALLISSSRP
jgi:hypothetical protein